jgi:hypothetical protein
MNMSSHSPRISHLVSSIENHPQSAILLPLVEHIFASSDSRTESQLVQSFHQLCNDDFSLRSEFEIIRGTIALEEGRFSHALAIFWKILHQPEVSHTSWNQVIEVFITNELLIHASLLLRIALDRFPQFPQFLQLAHEITPVLADRLVISPGMNISKTHPIISTDSESNILTDASSESESDPTSTNSPVQPNLLSSAVCNYWDQALECFEEYSSSQDSLNARGFVHYAHLTVRELLGVEGSFRKGIDQRIAFYQLSQFREFLIWLNQIRNKVSHDDYLPTLDQITQIRSQMKSLLEHPFSSSME